MKVPASWFVEPVTIESYLGQGAYGDQYAAAVTVLGHVSGGRRVQGTSEQEIVSEKRLLLPNPARLASGLSTVDPVALLTAESRVTTGTVSATVGQVDHHIQPGTGSVVYVSGELV